MENFKKVLWWLIGGSRGGKNRMRIIVHLKEEPSNANQLSEELDLDYKTIQHHLRKLEDANIIETIGEGYGKNYFLTDQMENNMNEMERIADKSGKEL